ncbi:MAG: hypothetical protein AABW41_05370 [Nanoarchaeota archaeon]
MVKAQYIFYVLGIIFLFSTVAYFSYQYLFNLSNTIKLIILICLIIASFFIADYLRERDI